MSKGKGLPGAPPPERRDSLLRLPTPDSWLEREPPDTGPARLARAAAGGTSPDAVGVKVVLPGVNFFPAGGYPINELGDANIAPGASADVLTLNIPEKLQLRLTGIGFGADEETALRFLTWSLLVGGTPWRAYGNQSAAIGTIGQPAEIAFQVGERSLITLRITSAATAVLTYRFVARLVGWFYTDERTG